MPFFHDFTGVRSYRFFNQIDNFSDSNPVVVFWGRIHFDETKSLKKISINYKQQKENINKPMQIIAGSGRGGGVRKNVHMTFLVDKIVVTLP